MQVSGYAGSWKGDSPEDRANLKDPAEITTDSHLLVELW